MKTMSLSTARALLVLIGGLGAAACAEQGSEPCGTGMLVESGSSLVCVYSLDEELVIEGGFECPSGFGYRFETSTAIACSERPITSLPAEACVRRGLCAPQVERTPSDVLITPAPEDAGAPLPPIVLRVRGAFGFCPLEGQALNATIQSNASGSGARIEAEVFEGFMDSCEGEDCLLTREVSRALTVSELAELRRLLEAVPDEACTPGASPICDPCRVNVISIDGEEHYLDSCSFSDEACPGTLIALSRIIGLIHRLGAEAIPARPPTRCLSPANFTSAAEGTPGCLCDVPGQSVCTQETAVYCAPGEVTSYTYWTPAIRSCASRCEVEHVVDDLDVCLATNLWCRVLPDGTVCSR